MERLELALSGVEQALRLAPARASMPGQGAEAQRPPAEGGGTATVTATAVAPPAWLRRVRRQLPRLMEALGAEQTESHDHTFTARARRLGHERNRLLDQLGQASVAIAEGCVSAGATTEQEQLRLMLMRLVHDIQRHHQRVNDMVYDGTWRDVGGSE
jgi:hypothetical protein